LFEGMVLNKINMMDSPHTQTNQLMMIEPSPDSDNQIIVAALHNQGYSIMPKVDYFIVIQQGKQFATVEAEVVYNNHPETWRMIDEFEMTLSELSAIKWQAFCEDVIKPFDIKGTVVEHYLGKRKKN
jgi:hypothetical protein